MIKKAIVLSFLISANVCSATVLPDSAADVNELLPDERNNVEIFQKFAPKVVYVHRLGAEKQSVSGRADAQEPLARMKKMGAGSGIVWDSTGHVVTNFHVIKGAENLAVTLGNQTFPAKVIGVEPRKDIAVLLVNAPKAQELLHNFTPFEIRHARDLQVGQKTLAIGNPFGLDHSLTTGVISALGRKVPGIGGVVIRDMIQTDASINPGNSGGPLLDSKGRLLGLNTVIYSNTGSSTGVGFAVPADDIERMVPQIIKNGRVILAGIGITRVDPRIALHLGIKRGVLVDNVLANSPASSAGLHGTYRDGRGFIHIGDVIVGLNGHPIANYDELYDLLTDIKVQESIRLTILRQGKTMEYTMKTMDVGAY